jgi:hypothetical protein
MEGYGESLEKMTYKGYLKFIEGNILPSSAPVPAPAG